VIGLLARWFYPGTVPLDWLTTIGLGVLGSFGGGLVTQLANKPKEGIRLHRAGLLMSILGSVIVLFVTKRMGLW
jgi:uncharacterized membrane protein YeaQ/YmgE (transglycosylase-associated protein family)